MARIYRKSQSDSDADAEYTQTQVNLHVTRPGATTRTSPRKKCQRQRNTRRISSSEDSDGEVRLVPKKTHVKEPRSKAVRLTPLHGFGSKLSQPNSETSFDPGVSKLVKAKRTMRSNIDKPRTLKEPEEVPLMPDLEEPDSEGLEIEVEESIWCDSSTSSNESDEELPSLRKLLALPPKPKLQPKPKPSAGSGDAQELSVRLEGLNVSEDFTDPFLNGTKADSRHPESSSDKENDAWLRFSPPRLQSPAKQKSHESPVTPLQSPSKSRLQSPSKTQPRIPTPPYRQSLDAFWDADTVNQWNDHYSPQKVLKSPKKLKFLQDPDLSPTSSPRKPQSPSKRSKTEIERRRNFNSSKHRIAEQFLAELDNAITQGQLRHLAASTGGVRFIWSKTLNSTAGRANWRRETYVKGTDKMVKHHASVELAEKVIDDEDRLLNVIAHEFCHLANFMISGIKDQPHGRQFKEWGRKCTQVFAHRGVQVTTKHSYEIEYKYVWQCSNAECANEFKRHSKSIDPKRHTCGACRSKLVQIKPAPRARTEGSASGSGSTSLYTAFMKEHYAAIKRDMPAASQKEVMEALGRRYRADKAGVVRDDVPEADDRAGVAGRKKPADEVDKIVSGIEVITLDDG